MQLTLDSISKKVGAQDWLYPMSLAPQPGAVTVLLGATQAGKTSLMRIMAGLDTPSQGRVQVDGRDVTGMPVRERNRGHGLPAVHQLPLDDGGRQHRFAAASCATKRTLNERVRELAQRLHIDMFLDRCPAELSGGQQQRVALARALAKAAPLMLLDEPLVNLDYKLREELRDELGQLFATGRLHRGLCHHRAGRSAAAGRLHRRARCRRAAAVRPHGGRSSMRPQSLRVARAFSDPPINLIAGRSGQRLGVKMQAGPDLLIPLPAAASKARVHAGCAGRRAARCRTRR